MYYYILFGYFFWVRGYLNVLFLVYIIYILIQANPVVVSFFPIDFTI